MDFVLGQMLAGGGGGPVNPGRVGMEGRTHVRADKASVRCGFSWRPGGTGYGEREQLAKKGQKHPPGPKGRSHFAAFVVRISPYPFKASPLIKPSAR